MNGKAVFKAAVEKMTESGREVLEKVGLKPADVSLFVPHQANLRIMSMVTDKLGINSGEYDGERQFSWKHFRSQHPVSFR